MRGFQKKTYDTITVNTLNADGIPTVRVRLPKKWNNEQFARAELWWGQIISVCGVLTGLPAWAELREPWRNGPGSGKEIPSLLLPGTSRMQSVILCTDTSNPRRIGCKETGTFKEYLWGTGEPIPQNDTSMRPLYAITYSRKKSRGLTLQLGILQNIITWLVNLPNQSVPCWIFYTATASGRPGLDFTF